MHKDSGEKPPALKAEPDRFMRLRIVSLLRRETPSVIFRCYTRFFLLSSPIRYRSTHKHHGGRDSASCVYASLLLISFHALNCSLRSYQFAKTFSELPPRIDISRFLFTAYVSSLEESAELVGTNLGDFSAHQIL